jgi:predicted ATPase/DNA-binding CsgD family transcriptional regulator
LIGRAREIATVCALLQREDVHLVTITGTAGVGKTRLALQVAAQLLDVFAGRVRFVQLAPVSDPELVMPSIAHTLGLQEANGDSIIDRLAAFLREQHVLLVLDNFEQILPAGRYLAVLLESCPDLTLLVTSREILHLRAEQQISLSPLALPRLERLQDPESLHQFAAVELFIQRVQSIKPDFHLTKANARPIAEICHRLDGLPLAIELAAARIKILSPQALLARLEHRLRVLTGGALDLPERQRTLRNTIAWSYDLLDTSEQRLFRRLAVYVNGCTLEEAEALCIALDGGSASDVQHVMDGITSLLDKSLLQQSEQETQEPRFGMLETIREYGFECLQESEEIADCQQAHALYFLSLAEQAEQGLKGAQQVAWLHRLEAEQGNFRAALGWFIERGAADAALRFAGALWRFWWTRGYFHEGQHWLQAALEQPEMDQTDHTTALRAKALCGLGWISSFLGDIAAAQTALEESAALFQQIGDQAGRAEALSELAEGVYRKDDTPAARALLEQCVTLSRDAGDQWILAMSLRTLGQFIYGFDPGDRKRATQLLEESMSLSRILGDKVGLMRSIEGLMRVSLAQGDVARAAILAKENLILAQEIDNMPDYVEVLTRVATATLYQGEEAQAIALLHECIARAQELGETDHAKNNVAIALRMLGSIALHHGTLDQATAMLVRSLSLARDVGFKDEIGLVLAVLGEARRMQGDRAQARKFCSEGLALSREIEHGAGIGRNLMGLAYIAIDEGRRDMAARLLGAASHWLNPETELDPFERGAYDHSVHVLRQRLGNGAYSDAWTQGQVFTLDQVLDAREAPVSGRSADTVRIPSVLTVREVEVLRLLAQGLTNARIAEQLVISRHTVNNHVRSILSKLGVSSRSGATRFAVEHQLV